MKAIPGSRGIISKIAKKCGCAWHTADTFIKKDKDLSELLQAEKESVLDIADERLYEAVDKGESWALKWFQATIGKKRGYTEKKEVQLSGSIIQRLGSLTDEELKNLEDRFGVIK